MKGIHRESEICICGHSSLVHIVKCCVEKCKCKKFRKEDKNMPDKKVKIKVSGYIEMSQENLEKLLASYEADLHMGLVYSIHMGYTDSSNLEFDIPE